jgi:hypothetical protein
MTTTTWKLRIKGLVSRPHNGGRVAVPLGTYTMREADDGDYLVTGNGQPDFKLTEIEVSTYLNERQIETVPAWP